MKDGPKLFPTSPYEVPGYYPDRIPVPMAWLLMPGGRRQFDALVASGDIKLAPEVHLAGCERNWVSLRSLGRYALLTPEKIVLVGDIYEHARQGGWTPRRDA